MLVYSIIVTVHYHHNNKNYSIFRVTATGRKLLRGISYVHVTNVQLSWYNNNVRLLVTPLLTIQNDYDRVNVPSYIDSVSGRLG